MRRGSVTARAAVGVLLAFALTACDRSTPSNHAPILLFVGDGTSSGDIAAVERILDREHLEYTTATSRQLNYTSASQLAGYRLVIVPGGNFIDMSGSLTPRTMANVREAVHGGVNYLGICAGAFLAGDGGSHYNSLDLTSGVRFGFYAAEKRGARKAAVMVASVGTPPIEHYWEDGPELTGWGTVVGKYPDGTPAVAEGASGKGWVILVGVHPEAPDRWRSGMRFTTRADDANAYAGTLIRAALAGTPLPHY